MECQGGRIDAAHHNGHAVRALSETLAFEKAIEVNFVIGTKFFFPTNLHGILLRKW